MAVIARQEITVSLERDINAVWRFYKIASSTSTPSAPTEAQGKTFVSSGTVPSGWSKVEPTYDGTSTNSLYTVDLTAFTDGEVSWSDVSKSSSYEAAKQAYNKAETAQSAANSKRRVFTSEPAPPYDSGDLWVLTSDATDDDEEETNTTSQIFLCVTTKASGSFDQDDWTLASTDDAGVLEVSSRLNDAIDQLSSGLNDLDTAVNGDGTDGGLAGDIAEAKADIGTLAGNVERMQESTGFIDEYRAALLNAIKEARQNAERLEELGQYIGIVDAILLMTATGSPFSVALSESFLEFRHEGERKAWMDANSFHFSEGVVDRQLRIGNFLLKDYNGRFDVVYSEAEES